MTPEVMHALNVMQSPPVSVEGFMFASLLAFLYFLTLTR